MKKGVFTMETLQLKFIHYKSNYNSYLGNILVSHMSMSDISVHHYSNGFSFFDNL